MAYEESEDNEVQENDERIDNEIDRIYKHVIESQTKDFIPEMARWAIITGCNKTLDEYRIAFDDVTEDCINLNSVDGIEIVWKLLC